MNTNKRKFSKLLNKEVEYTAIRKQISNNGSRILLTDVKHKGKLYADHAWVVKASTLEDIDAETNIIFNATAYMYNDKFNVRKQGLKNCNSYHKINKDYNDQRAIEKSNKFHQEQRLQKRK